MASFKLLLSAHVKANGKQSIQLRITINRRVIPRSTGFEVLAKDWDKAKERVRPSNKNFTYINDALATKLSQAEREFATVVSEGNSADAKQVANKTFSTHDFYKHAEGIIKAMVGPTQMRTQKGHQGSVNTLKKFAPTLSIEQINAGFIKDYKKYLEASEVSLGKKMSRNTVIKLLYNFRALYNMSIHRTALSPFDSVVIGEGTPARIEPLTVTEISRLWNYQPEHPGERRALDMFLFSYYALGMRIGDVIQMKWAYIREDENIIRYDQTKKEHLQSDDVLEVPFNRWLRDIVARWPKKTPYVFGTITATDPWKIKRQVESIESSINKSLKVIAIKVGITKWIAGKVARKTFSDVANKRTGRNIYLIQQGMGHSKVSTTEGYVGRDPAAMKEISDKTYGD